MNRIDWNLVAIPIAAAVLLAVLIYFANRPPPPIERTPIHEATP